MSDKLNDSLDGKTTNENELHLNEMILKAAEDGDLLGVKRCLSRDQSVVMAVDSDLYTPLHRSAYNNHTEVMRLLIRRGADVRARTLDGWTPLHCASKWANTGAADLLINCGADINAVSDGGNTALHLAASHNNRQLLELFLHNQDIDITLTNDSGETAYQIAKRSSPLHQLWHYL